MATDRIKVRNKITDEVAWLPARALRHFPDFERVDEPAAAAAPAPAPQTPAPAPAPAPVQASAPKTRTTSTPKKEG